MMLRLFCTIIFALSVHAGTGTVTPKPAKHLPLVLKMDSTRVTVRQLDSAAITAYRKMPEFQYNDDVETTPSWWIRFWHWFWGLFKPINFGKHDPGPFMRVLIYIIKYIFIAAGLAAIVLLVFKLAGIDMLHIFRRRSMQAEVPYSESLENIHEINFDAEIEKAIAQHNYRLAVRMLYLRCLKQLSDADLIKWQIDKTNSTYINELNNTEQRKVFKTLTLQFEYVWYGEFIIDAAVFKNINTLFQDFKKSIV